MGYHSLGPLALLTSPVSAKKPQTRDLLRSNLAFKHSPGLNKPISIIPMAAKIKSEEPRKSKCKSKPKLEEAYLYHIPNLHLDFPPQEQASQHTPVDQSLFLSSTSPQSGESSPDRRLEVLKLLKENLQLELQVLQLRKQIPPPIVIKKLLLQFSQHLSSALKPSTMWIGPAISFQVRQIIQITTKLTCLNFSLGS